MPEWTLYARICLFAHIFKWNKYISKEKFQKAEGDPGFWDSAHFDGCMHDLSSNYTHV